METCFHRVNAGLDAQVEPTAIVTARWRVQRVGDEVCVDQLKEGSWSLWFVGNEIDELGPSP